MIQYEKTEVAPLLYVTINVTPYLFFNYFQMTIVTVSADINDTPESLRKKLK
jgi:hypothetical protein